MRHIMYTHDHANPIPTYAYCVRPHRPYAPLLKSNLIFFAMSKIGIYVQNIDLQFFELYYDVFCYEQVNSHNNSFHVGYL